MMKMPEIVVRTAEDGTVEIVTEQFGTFTGATYTEAHEKLIEAMRCQSERVLQRRLNEQSPN